MTPDRVVDARGLPPPEPMELALQALELRRPGEAVRLLIHRQPYPLYELLAAQGYAYHTRSLADGCYEIIIRAAGTDV